MPRLSARFQSLPEYPLAAIPQKKRELLARGVDVIDLGAGDADLAPPPAAVEALERAARTPAMSRYGFGLGLPAYRDAVAKWMERRFGLRFDPLSEIVPLIGSKEGIAHLALGYLERGDIAVIPEPGYLAYLGGALLAQATPHLVPLRPENQFLLELDDLPRDILRRTRMVYVNYPNNPTSAATPAACTAMNAPVSTKLLIFASGAASGFRAAAQPIRHPVMLYVLDSEWNSMATSPAPSISKMLGGR